MLLQFHSPAPWVEIRESIENARHAGGIGVEKADIPRGVHVGAANASSCPDRDRLQGAWNPSEDALNCCVATLDE